MFKLSYILINILLTLNSILPSSSHKYKLTVKIEEPKESGMLIEKDLIKFIHEGKMNILEKTKDVTKRSKVIMVMGTNGVGKTTLINYLNNIPMVGKKLEDKWVIDIESSNFTLPGDFQIEHQAKPVTFYPNIFSPDIQQYSFIDNPGFVDTRRLAILIANGYFRELITEYSTHLKFLVLVKYQDLDFKSKQFYGGLKSFFRAIGQVDSLNMEKVSKSIGLIISKTENEANDDLFIKSKLKWKFSEALKDEKMREVLNQNEIDVLNRVISNDQMEIFSKAMAKMKLNDVEKKNILDLMDRLEFVKKDDINLRAKIESIHVPYLLNYTTEHFIGFKNDLDNKLDELTEKYYVHEIDQATEQKDLLKLVNTVKEIFDTATQELDFETFMSSIDQNILERSEKDVLINKKLMLDFIINLLPEEYRGVGFYKNEWLNEYLTNKLRNYLNELKSYNENESIQYEDKTGVFIYSCSFANISHILEKINNNNQINNLTSVRIYATHSVSFDVDYILNNDKYQTNTPDLVVISPNVLVKKTVNVNLSCNKTIGFPDNKENADDGEEYGENGHDGKPGLPGWNGGNFLVLANKIKDKYLKYESRGCRGGPGQNGGHGKEGKKGKDAEIKDVENNNESLFYFEDLTNYSRNKTFFEMLFPKKKHGTYFRKFGEVGSKGGDGGSGGCGGKGGYAGTKFIIDMSSNKHYKHRLKQKQTGLNGKAGNPGLGGFYGDMAIRRWVTKKRVFITYKNNWSLKFNQTLADQRRGPRGEKNFQKNCNDRIDSRQTNFNFYEYENEYLKYIIQVSDNKFNNSKLHDRNYLKSLIDETYFRPEIKFLIERIQLLDKKEFSYLLYNVKNELIEFYQDKNLTDKEKMVISYVRVLLSSILNRVSSAKDYLVVNVEKFLEQTLTDIEGFNSLTHKGIQISFAKNYENNIKIKIENANEKIQLLVKDLSKHEKAISKLLESIVNEINELQESLENRNNAMLERKNELNKAIKLKAFFITAKIAIHIISFIGVKGEIAAAVGKKVIDSKEKSIEELINRNNESLANIDEIIQKYAKKSALLEKLNAKKSSIKKRALRLPELVVEKIQKKVEDTIELAEYIYDSIEELNTMSEQVKEIEIDAKQNLNRFNSLRNIESNINEFNFKIKKNLHNQINDLILSLNNDSMSGLILNKFRIKEFLTDLKNNLVSFVNSLDLKEDISNTMNRLVSVIETIIDLHASNDHLLEQSEIVKYMSLLDQNSYLEVNYQFHLNELKKTIHENLISERYRVSIEAFKHWSFPLFCQYTKNLEIRESLAIKTNNSIPEMINKYSSVLNVLLRNIKNSQAEIKPSIDNHIIGYSFESDNPFFKWTSKNYQLEINQLLRGEKATFYANVNNSKYDAIRFCTLYLKIEIKSSASDNKTLNELLEKFNVELVHSGESNYRFKGVNYKINSNFNSEDKLMLKYQYPDKIENANDSFKKLSINKPLLSPYTFWEIRLSPVKPEKKSQLFYLIDKLVLNKKSDIVISLCGKGQYISDSIKLDNPLSCSLN